MSDSMGYLLTAAVSKEHTRKRGSAEGDEELYRM